MLNEIHHEEKKAVRRFRRFSQIICRKKAQKAQKNVAVGGIFLTG